MQGQSQHGMNLQGAKQTPAGAEVFKAELPVCGWL